MGGRGKKVNMDELERGGKRRRGRGGLLMTPVIRLAMTSTNFGLVGDLDLIRTAELCRTVSMALRPAKTIV